MDQNLAKPLGGLKAVDLHKVSVEKMFVEVGPKNTGRGGVKTQRKD